MSGHTPLPTLTFSHIYLLLDCHQSPQRVITLSASRLRNGLDLLRYELLEENEGRWHPTQKALKIIDDFAIAIANSGTPA